ncbi:HNH endonuclease signature motif containing protein [Luteipulveratus flavus]|uniref:DUF222 domain-containing protein n=1 Tax=Luteipulveratus flavus TaxID=3031728 RepID=A0ABT6CBX7_9MICO|nr:HNH endonuclease signature motif containing protein [Luteipulveratus sp. YIM 133296]MDF8266386.1 DUF222 domain-containing protein [Luteipulveratus sp. YIM 133296]
MESVSASAVESLLTRVPPGPAADAVRALGRAVGALAALPDALHQVGSDDLGALVGLLGETAARAQASIVMATAEAQTRGVVRESRAASTAQWVSTAAGGLDAGDASRIAVVSTAVTDPENALLREAVASAQCSPRAAQVTLRELEQVMPSLPDFTRTECMAYFMPVAASGTAKDLRHLARWLVATYADDRLERDDARLEEVESLTWSELPGGLRRFVLDLAPAHAARLASAVQAGAGPQPVVDPETGVQAPDLRSPAKRRADALMELVALVQSADTSVSHGSTTKLVLTMNLEHLRRDLRAASEPRDLGSVAPAADLAPRSPVRTGGLAVSSIGDTVDAGTVRRLACDADVIPLVLGSRSEPLDVGREQRLVKDGLRTAVVARDGCCTFPGCDRPPGFCEVHHVVAWYRGGDTSLLNSALLCRRHHTIVHRDGLVADVTPYDVRWAGGHARSA